MKNFFGTYWTEVLKPNLKWAKNHWKGLIILWVILCAFEMVWIFWSDITNWVQNKIMYIKLKRFAKREKA